MAFSLFLSCCSFRWWNENRNKKKNAKISKNQKKNAFLFVNNKYHHELLLFAGKRRSSCDDTENINNEY